VERKQVEGEFVFLLFVLLIFPSGIRSHLDHLCSWLLGLRAALGYATTQSETVSAAYNSSEQELEELRAAALETFQVGEEGEAQARSSLASRLRALGGHVSRRMRRALHLGVQKALGVVGPTNRWTSRPWCRATLSQSASKTKVAMERADALTAAAAETLAEDFVDFLFPDAPDTGEPQA
jgi:hypothetical protein